MAWCCANCGGEEYRWRERSGIRKRDRVCVECGTVRCRQSYAHHASGSGLGGTKKVVPSRPPAELASASPLWPILLGAEDDLPLPKRDKDGRYFQP